MDNNILSRYELARSIMQGYQTNQLVLNDAIFPHWITSTDSSNSGFFWYLRETKTGKEFRLVDVGNTSNTPAFDHDALATSLSEATGKVIDSEDLPFVEITLDLSTLRVRFQAFENEWLFDSSNGQCHATDSPVPKQQVISPDERNAVFLRNNNLWIKDLRTGEERALTTDGTEDLSYGKSLFGIDATIQVQWSPNSKKLFAAQLDTNGVTTRYMVSYVPEDGNLHPTVNEFKVAYPGDKQVESYRLMVIDVDTGLSHTADYPKLTYVNHGPETFDGFFTGNLGWWSSDSRYAYFVDLSSRLKKVSVLQWDTDTGAVNTLLEENTSSFIRIREDTLSGLVFLPLPEYNELIWFSDRSGWAHLYLYDLSTGKLKHSITEGQWMVRGILHYNAEQRELLLQTSGRDPEINPYYRDICKVSIDSKKLTPLIAGPYDHIVYSSKNLCVMKYCFQYNMKSASKICGVSPDGRYIITTQSRVDTPPVTILLDKKDSNNQILEHADTSGLPKGWSWPEPVRLKAGDNQTDIYGVIFRPPNFSTKNRYPVIDFVSGMRCLNLIPDGSFVNSHFSYYFEMAALAALGFIVVGIVGRGTPLRSKAFQDHGFGKPGYEDDLNDHIAGLHQLANRYPYMDLERVGLTSMESAVNVVYGSLRHSEFYKVTVSHCFTDPRDIISLQEMYHGLNDKDSLYHFGGPEDYVESFSGKLLLINGLRTTVDSTFRLVEALQKANKDFDMLCLPNLMGQVTAYTRRRGWDYLVKHLQGIDPPHQFQLSENATGNGWDMNDINSD